jgi:hypothetical protein
MIAARGDVDSVSPEPSVVVEVSYSEVAGAGCGMARD